MSGWLVLLLILLALLLVGQIRVGAWIGYDAAGLVVRAIVGPARIQVLPAKDKGTKPDKRRKQRRKAVRAAEQKEKRPGSLARLMDLLPVLAEAAGALRRKILIHHLDLSVVWGAPDAAGAAIGFGRAHGVIGMIWPLFDHNFRVKRHRFQVDVDYGASRPEVRVELELTLTVGQALAFVLRYGGKALARWSRSGRRAQQRQEA
ncbi:MAG TPA: DUF2953 domain-containing protein [Candidatus Enterenecus merdae]|nr:DUF2953 domain-containing protein [Candidatus Enterenecus merdae]